MTEQPLADLSKDEQKALAEIAKARVDGRVSRRDLVKAGSVLGLGGLLGGGAGAAITQPAKADPQGNLGTSADPWDTGYINNLEAQSVSTDDAQFNGTPWVDVRNYGAVGDGSTDDSGAIQSAVDDAFPGGSVYFPPGTYFVENTISGLHQGRIVGPESRGHPYWFSQDGVTIQSTEAALGDGGEIFRLSDDGSSVQDIGFYNVRFAGDASVDANDLENADQTGIVGINVNGVKDGLVVDGCSFRGLKLGIGNIGSTYVGHIAIDKCQFRNSTEAINAETTVPLVVENCGFYHLYDWITGNELAVRGCTFQNDSFATNRTNISGRAIHAEDNWFEGGNDFLDVGGQTNGRIIAENNHFGAAQASSGSLKHIFRIDDNASVYAAGNFGEENNRILRGSAVNDWSTVTVELRGNEWQTYNWYSGHDSPGEEGAKFTSIDETRNILQNIGVGNFTSEIESTQTDHLRWQETDDGGGIMERRVSSTEADINNDGAVATAPRLGVVWVYGQGQRFGSIQFIDRVVCSSSGNTIMNVKKYGTESPDDRTYSVSSGDLVISIDTDDRDPDGYDIMSEQHGSNP